MDKRVVFAVAGSGKTSSIIDLLDEDSRCLIVTYTENNAGQLKHRVIRKLGSIPRGVRIYTYFTFLYSFCFRPLCGYETRSRGINFDIPLLLHVQRSKKNTVAHYMDGNRKLYASRVAKYLIEANVVNEVVERLEGFFDLVCIDEIQDFAANDFNLLCNIAAANVNMLLVGDFYQHTFDTSRDGATQKNLHKNFEKYCQKIEKAGYLLDLASLSHSHRCSPEVCAFVTNNLGIDIQSHRTDAVQVRLVSDEQEIEKMFYDDSVVKLYYQRCDLYSGNSENWGNTKGLDHFTDVCVVLNPGTMKHFESETLDQLPAMTLNKLYVACTRAKGDLYFINEDHVKKYRTVY